MFEPGAQEESVRWNVLRIVAGQPQIVTIASAAPLWLATHWVGQPAACPGDECPLCLLLPRRSQAFFAVRHLRRLKILELGAHSACALEQLCKLMNSQRVVGSTLELSRRHRRSEVRPEFVEHDPAITAVDRVKLLGVVAPLYRLPHPKRGESLDEYESRITPAAMQRAIIASQRLKAS